MKHSIETYFDTAKTAALKSKSCYDSHYNREVLFSKTSNAIHGSMDSGSYEALVEITNFNATDLLFLEKSLIDLGYKTEWPNQSYLIIKWYE